MAEDGTAKPGKGAVFLRRLVSTVVLWGVILGGLFSGIDWLSRSVFLVIMLLLTVTGLLEFYGLVRERKMICFAGLGVAGGVLLTGANFWAGLQAGEAVPAWLTDVETSLWVLLVLGLCLWQLVSRGNPHGLQAVGMTLLGVLYVAFLLNFIQKIYFMPGINGTLYLVYFIVVTKFSDTGAYCVGSLIGRHKMIPRISPGKTWEGFGGAILVPVGISLLFAWLAGDRLSGMTYGHAVALGLILSGGAVVGDLIESLFKREAGVKDSGNFFPGIGGILDLLDSLLFTAPLMYLYLRLAL